MEYNSTIKKNEILPFAATWMDLEGIMLSEISQRKTNTVWYNLYVESKKYNKLVNVVKQRQNHRYRQQTSGYQWVGEEGNVGLESGKCKLLLQDRLKDLLYKMGNIDNIL